MNNPLVSIILPTYNGNSKWISQAIDSVLNQTYTNRELIVINDASTNDIENTILEYTEKDKRIQYHKNDKNMERSYSKNR
jgi:glycosyltransferase involved in cell wall biosynthesis